MWVNKITQQVDDNGQTIETTTTEHHQSWYDPAKEAAGAAVIHGIGFAFNLVAIPVSGIWGAGRALYQSYTKSYGSPAHGLTADRQVVNKPENPVDKAE